MARPAHQPSDTTRRQVEAMAGYGVTETDIARTLAIDPKTLRRHYRPELDLGHVKANSAVAQALFRKATGDGPQSVTAAIFWAKARMGWKETQVTEHSGPEGGPIRTEVTTRDMAKALLLAITGPSPALTPSGRP